MCGRYIVQQLVHYPPGRFHKTGGMSSPWQAVSLQLMNTSRSQQHLSACCPYECHSVVQ